jgi:Arc/MetJ-type ribon-helix-helix transcriptional regulator
MSTEAVSVTLPAADLARVRDLVRAGRARSVSAYLADALHHELTREERAERAIALLHKFFGDPYDGTPEQNAEVEAWIERAEAVAAANWARAHGQNTADA